MAQDTVDIVLDLKEGKHVKSTANAIQKQIKAIKDSTKGSAKGSALGDVYDKVLKYEQRLERVRKNALKAAADEVTYANRRAKAVERTLAIESATLDRYDMRAKRDEEFAKSRRYSDKKSRVASLQDQLAGIIDYRDRVSEALAKMSTTKLLGSDDALRYWASQSHEIEGLSRVVDDLATRMADLKQAELEAAQEAARLQAIKDSAVISNEEIFNLNNRLKELVKEQAQLEELGVGLGTQRFDENASEIDSIKNKLAEYRDALNTTTNAIRQQKEAEREKARAEREAEAEARRLAAAQESARISLQTSAANVSKLGSAMLALSTRLHLTATATGKLYDSTTGMPSLLEKLSIRCRDLAPIAGAVGKAFNIMGKLGKGAISALKHLASTLGKLKLHFKSASGSSEKFSTKLKHLSSWLTKYLLGFRSFFYLYRRLRGQIGEGFKELAKQSPEFNASISSILTSLYQLRAGFAAAFAPIVNAVAPLLNTLIAKLNEATVAIANFFATLTGSKTILKATAVQQDYADSLDKTGSSAKDAKKNVDKFTTGIDELNVIDDSSSSSGSGSSSGQTAAFEEVETEMSNLALMLMGFAQMVMDAWKNSDFTNIGEVIGELIRDGLNKIPWDKIKETAAKVGTSLATLLNGLISVDGLATSIGTTIGEAINTVFTGLHNFASKVEWKKLGDFISEGIQSFLTTTDFALAGQALFELIGGALETAVTVTGNQKTWDLACQAIVDFIDNIHWDTLLVDVTKLGANIITGIAKAITAINTSSLGDTETWKKVGRKVGNIIKTIPWGELFVGITKIASNILIGIATAISSISIDTEANRKVWHEVGDAVGQVLAAIPWKELFTGFKLLGDGIMEGIGAAIESATGLPEGAGRKIAELIAVGGLTLAIANVVSKIMGSGGLLSAFKKKDDALERQTEKVTADQVATEGLGSAISNAFNPVTILAAALVILGLRADTATASTDTAKTSVAELDTQVQTSAETITQTVTTAGDTVENKLSTTSGVVSNESESMINAIDSVGTEAETVLVTNMSSTLDTYQDNLVASQTATSNWAQNTLSMYETWANGVNEAMVNASKDIEDVTEGETVAKKTTNLSGFRSSIASAGTSIVKTALSAVSNAGAGKVSSIFGSADLSDILDGVKNTSGVATLATVLALLQSLGVSPSVLGLANGAVLPPNQPFLAMVGDQKSGTNIEAPLDTIKQAVAEVTGGYEVLSAIQQLTSVVSGLNLTVNLDGKRVESNSRSVVQRRGAVIATGGIYNYS